MGAKWNTWNELNIVRCESDNLNITFQYHRLSRSISLYQCKYVLKIIKKIINKYYIHLQNVVGMKFSLLLSQAQMIVSTSD